MKKNFMSRARGFSLIELMIAVVIVGILAMVAYPSYEGYQVRTRRSEAQQLMMQISSRQAQFILDARSYAQVIGPGGLNIVRQGWTCAETCTNGFYTIAVVPDNLETPPEYVVTATPSGKQAGDGTMSVDHTGAKSRMVGESHASW